MPKSTKRFTFTNSALNGQGFRLLSEGGMMDDFYKNPVMLYNHQRPESTDKNQILPIGHWEDIELNGDDWSAVPVFDDKDDFAMSIYHKVEAGHIRMCSIGAEPLQTSAKAKDLLPGQTRPTVTKWRAKEVSICDIGANPGALAVALYDSKDNLIKLSQTSIDKLIPTIKMATTKKPKAAAGGKAAAAQKKADDAKKLAIKLADEAAKLADEDPEAELSGDDPEAELADTDPEAEDDKDAIIEDLKKQIADLKSQLELAQEQLNLADEKDGEAKAENLANKALALRKITLAQKAHIIKLAKVDYNGTVQYLNTIKATPSVKEVLAAGEDTKTGDVAQLEKLSAKSWDELFHAKGEMDFIKLKAPEVYKAKFKQKFGRDPRNA
jgi:phage head maturation protease